jgi:hypothetical protein
MRSSGAAASGVSETVNFQRMREKMQAGAVEWKVIDSRKPKDPPGTKRRFLECKDVSGAMMFTMGDPALPAEQSPILANQPGPSKKNPASRVYNALYKLDGAEADAMMWCWDWIMASALKEQVFGAQYTTLAALAEVVSLPFTKPDAEGKGEYGVWVSWQLDAPAGFENLRTKFMVSRATPDEAVKMKILRQYDGTRMARGMHSSCLTEFGEFRMWDGHFRGDAKGRVVLIDESQALDDAAPMPTSAARATGYAFPYNGGHIVYGTAAHPTPAFVTAGSEDISHCNLFMDIVQFTQLYKEGKVALTAVQVKGVTHYYYNIAGVKGNPLIAEGRLTDPAELQPYLMKTPAAYVDPSKKPEDSFVLDGSTIGALTAITDPEHQAAYTEAAELKLAQIFEMKVVGTGKKYDTLDKIRGEVALSGGEPEKEGDHFYIWQKLNIKAPKDIEELRTQFWLISEPGEPWSCERIDGTTLVGGRCLMSGYEMSEVKRATGKWREVLYAKVVFVCKPSGGSGIRAASWGGQVLNLEAAAEEGEVQGDDAPAAKRGRFYEDE